MTLPESAVASSASYFWVDDEGILNILNKPKKVHDLQDALENVQIAREIAKDNTHPLLIDMTNIRLMNRGARQVYVAESERKYVIAVALVTTSITSRVVSNFFLGLNKLPVPTKLFNDKEAAKKWLLEQV